VTLNFPKYVHLLRERNLISANKSSLTMLSNLLKQISNHSLE